MSDVQEQILDAVKILADNAVSASNATITIECKIIEVIDAGVGLYKVEYKANKFECYSSNPSIVYNIDDTVYVIVPDGDFDKNKTIIGAVAPVASMYVETEKVDNYIPISENLIREREVIELSTYHTRSESIDPPNPIIIDNPVIDDFKLLFPDYLKTYNTYLFSAKIKTNIELSQQVQGNYGLKLSLPIISNDKQVENYYKDIILDVSNIEGSPYRLTEYSLQNIYFELPEDTTYDDSRVPILIAFVENFPEQKEEVDPIPAEDINIWIKDISLKAVDVLTVENKEGYYLSLVSDKGNYFLAGDGFTTKTLSPVLKIKGKNTSVKNYDCYWFLEDASVDTTSDDYTTIGGLGWRCLNVKTNVTYTEEGKMTFQYVTNVYELKVTNEDVYGSSKYKCVLTRGNVVISGSLVLHNFQYEIRTELVSATGSNDFIKDTGYVTLISKVWDKSYNPATMQLRTAWQRFDKNGNFYEFEENENGYEIIRLNVKVEDHYETEIRFRSSLVEDLNLITCSVYRSEVSNDKIKEFILGTNSLVVTTSDNFVYKVAVQNGDVLYKYDADGDSPMIADYGGPVSSRISATKPLTYRIFKADGLELSETEYLYCDTEWCVPINSMINIDTKRYEDEDEDAPIITNDEVYYYVAAKKLYYTIASVYNVKKNNNTILLNINLPDVKLNESINIKFLKDGEGGTNGSRYAGLITYNGFSYGEEGRKLQFICFRTQSTAQDEWYQYFRNEDGTEVFDKYDKLSPTGIPVNDNRYFNVKVWNDGDLITDTSLYRIEWSVFDPESTTPFLKYNNNYFILNVRKWTTNEVYVTTLQAKITIKNKGQGQQGETEIPTAAGEEVLYAYYPIEVTYVNRQNNEPINNFVYNLEGGFEKVLYASDGTNPKYDNTNPFTLGLNILDATYKREEYKWEASKNFTLKPSNANPPDPAGLNCIAKPIAKYDSGESKNFIKVYTKASTGERQGYKRQASDAADKKANLEIKLEKINNEQDRLNSALDFPSILSYNDYIGLLDNGSYVVNNRYNGIFYLGQVLSTLDSITSYCVSSKISDYFNSIYLHALQLYAQREKEILINLGNTTTISSLHDELNTIMNHIDDNVNTVISEFIPNEGRFKNRYGIAVYTKMCDYITNLVNMKKKYAVCYNNLIAVMGKQEEINYNTFITTLRNTSTVPELDILIAADAEVFGQIPNRLNIIVNSLFVEISSYNYIETKIIKEILELIDSYRRSYYKTYYEKERKELEKEIEKQTTLIDDYTKMANSCVMEVTHIKPILLLYNRYEMTNLNDWDGNKIYTGETDTYLFAPQIGAGKKEGNAFTGIVMGLKNIGKSSITTQIGLFGYSSGAQSIFLNAKDGSATFGKSGKAQIILDPNDSGGSGGGVIRSGNYKYSKNPPGTGMEIGLTEAYIKFGSTNFEVDSNGHLTAKGGGSIAGWEIDNYNIYSNNGVTNKRIYLNSQYQEEKDKNGNAIKDQNNNTLYTNGKIYSSPHNTLDSTGEGFYLSQNGLSIGDNIKIISYNGGSIEIGRLSGNRKWTITGDSSNSYIGYNADGLYYSYGSDTPIDTGSGKAKTNSVFIGTNGIRLGQKFAVDYQGQLYCTSVKVKGDIKADTGYIGDWTISGGKIVGQSNNGQITLDAKGAIEGKGNKKWSIDKSGRAEFNDIYITGGDLNIGSKAHIDSNGDATFTNITATGTIYASGGYIGQSGNSISADGLAFGAGSIDLSNEGQSDKIKFSSDGVDIQGKITATSGEIGGCSINNGVLSVPAANISGKLTASQIETDKLTIGAANITGTTDITSVETYTTSYETVKNTSGQDVQVLKDITFTRKLLTVLAAKDQK